MPSVVAVVSVIAIVVAMVAFFAGGDDDVAEPQAAQAEAEATSTPTGSASPETPEATRTPGSRSSDGAPARAREARPKADEKGERGRAQQKKQRRTRPEPDTGPPDVYVEVYNNTSISGLAAATAAELQDAGWQVVGVDNWRGDIPASTVYYPAGFEEEARELAETIGVGRLHGAVAPMRFDRLTVILTPDAA